MATFCYEIHGSKIYFSMSGLGTSSKVIKNPEVPWGISTLGFNYGKISNFNIVISSKTSIFLMKPRRTSINTMFRSFCCACHPWRGRIPDYHHVKPAPAWQQLPQGEVREAGAAEGPYGWVLRAQGFLGWACQKVASKTETAQADKSQKIPAKEWEE